MKYIIFQDYFTGKTISKRSLPKAVNRSISYGFEYIGSKEYFVVRDYYNNSILHKFARTSRLQGSLRFHAIEE